MSSVNEHATTWASGEWEPCPFSLHMADTSSVRPTGLIQDLEVTIGGHVFCISVVVLQLNVQGAYPLLLGWPWLRMAHIKQNWQKNIITFRRGKTKVWVATQQRAVTSKEATPLYAESINMLEGLPDEEIDRYLEEHPKIVPLFEVDITAAVGPYITSLEGNDYITESKSIPVGGGGPQNYGQTKAGKSGEGIVGRREEGNGHIVNKLSGRVRMVVRRHARSGSPAISTPNSPQHRCQTSSTTKVPHDVTRSFG